MSSEGSTVVVRFDAEDLELLNALVAEERLSRSDVVRRAVRAYAEKLSVTVAKKRKR